MTVYRRLRDTDVLQTVLTLGPRTDAVSGTSGWRGGPDGSGSVSLYSGPRGPGAQAVRVVPRYFPSQVDHGYIQPPSGTYPMSSSLKYVDVVLTDRTENPTNWGNRTWSLVDRLYDYYSQYSDRYNTSSWDYQCVFFAKRARNMIMSSDQGVKDWWQSATASMTLEAWVKPFSTSSVNYSGYTIASVSRLYRLYVTGTDGRLAFSSSLGIQTSSLTMDHGRWNHVAVSLGNGTGSLYVNLGRGNDFTYSGVLEMSSASFSPLFCIGGVYQSAEIDVFGDRQQTPGTTKLGFLAQSFHGLIQEVRLWNTTRSWTQISSSHNVTVSSGSSGLVKYFKPTAGHRYGATYEFLGSSSFDAAYNPDNYYFLLSSFENQVSWTPCDNPLFYPEKNRMLHYTSGSSRLWNVDEQEYVKDRFKVINIPRLFYGSQIATGSVELMCRSFTGTNREMIRTLRDDGLGGLYVHSYMSSSLDSSDEKVPWNTVGNVFYNEGIIVLTDDSLIDFANADQPGSVSTIPTDLLSVSFRGVTRIPTRMVSCRVDSAQGNASNNETFSRLNDDTGKRELTHDRTTYVTAVGLYGPDRRLLGVVKLANPLRKRERDRLNIRVKIDF
jgi:hypothetical protein